jgi:hypothetical protein
MTQSSVNSQMGLVVGHEDDEDKGFRWLPLVGQDATGTWPPMHPHVIPGAG